jgi:glycosyltransferase involved in cell wall biosynthesis
MNENRNPLKICIDARMISGTVGGVEQVVIGIAGGLSNLTDGDEEYYFMAYAEADDWLTPYIAGNCKILHSTAATRQPKWMRFLKAIPFVPQILRKVSQRTGNLISPQVLPRSDGTIEKLGIDVMHFPSQNAFLTEVPSVYQPHDLQHLHLPELFEPRVRENRELWYRTFCQQASLVVLMSAWGKQDIIKHYGLSADKVEVVPGAPVSREYPTPSGADLVSTQKKYDLPDAFIFYPAQTWEHKNHIGLLQALAIVRDRYGLLVPLISSGKRTDFFAKIEEEIGELQLAEQVKFLGFVSPLEMQCLYHLCRSVIFPSKFEGWGMPLMEAFQANAPLACSNIRPLPEQVKDAALIFDPYNPAEIAEAIYKLWTDRGLCKDLTERGTARVNQFSWDYSARLFRAHYRRLAKRALDQEDRLLLSESPLV